MLDKLFGKKETLEEVVLKDPFSEKQLEKKLSGFKLDLKNPYLLHLCAKNDRHEALLFLIQQGINPNTLDVNGENVLFTALKHNSANCCKALLLNKINVNQENNKGVLPIHLACKSAMLDIFEIIVNKTDNILKCDKQGRNILFYAVFSKNKDMINRVLEEDIDINHKDNKDNTIIHLEEITFDIDYLKELLNRGLDIKKVNKLNEDFVYLNCLNLDIEDEVLSSFLRMQENINRNYGFNGETLLMKIIDKILSIDIQIFENKGVVTKYQERILSLIESGVNQNNTNYENENILFNVVRQKDDLTFDFVINRIKVEINKVNKQGKNLLDLAIFNGKPNVELVKNLIYSDIDCTLKDKDGYTVVEKLVDVILSHALPNRVRKIGTTKSFKSIDYVQILKLILDYSKVNINNLEFEGEPLVFEVGRSFYVPLLEILKRHGANLEVASPKDGLNIFYKVLESGKSAKDARPLFLKMLNFLVMSNVNLDHKDSYGGNVIHKAILDHDLQVVNILIKRINDFTFTDRKGRTYIHNAVWSDKVDILKKIALKNKDLMNMPDKFGLLPINYAVIMGKKDCVFELMRLGAVLNNPNNVNETFKEQFFAKLGKLEDILNSTMTENERKLMVKLVKNMQEELNIE